MYLTMKKTIKAELILENGVKFKGNAFGYIKETVGEVVLTLRIWKVESLS